MFDLHGSSSRYMLGCVTPLFGVAEDISEELHGAKKAEEINGTKIKIYTSTNTSADCTPQNIYHTYLDLAGLDALYLLL